MSTCYDDLIIGTGQAGPSLAARLSAAGMKVAIVERGAFVGTCVNTGRIPTKTLVASAAVARAVRRSSEFGVSAGGPVADDLGLGRAGVAVDAHGSITVDMNSPPRRGTDIRPAIPPKSRSPRPPHSPP